MNKSEYRTLVEPQLDVIVCAIHNAQKEIDELRRELIRFKDMVEELKKELQCVWGNLELSI
jgi:predicted RNase H-like nuclease (RuvC/YqgF family)